MLGEYEETSCHNYSVLLWMYVTEGSFTVITALKVKQVMNKGMGCTEAMNWCHKVINGHQESKAIVFYMGSISKANNLSCKQQ